MGALISVVIDGLGELTKAASEGYKTLVNQQNVAAKEMEVSAQASLASTQSALHTLHSDSHAAWHNMMDEIKHESSTFHDEISRVSKATMSDIGTMAMASQGQLEDFNRVMNEFKTNQGDILWQLRALHRALRVFTGMVLAGCPHNQNEGGYYKALIARVFVFIRDRRYEGKDINSGTCRVYIYHWSDGCA